MKLSRRRLLQTSLGATQLALLAKFGFSKSARADIGGAGRPRKLLTIYIPGGIVPQYLWVPFTDAAILSHIPEPRTNSGEPVFYRPEHVRNLDGSDDEIGINGNRKLRGVELWDEAALSQGNPDPRTGQATAPHGWSWKHHELFNNASVVHGVDQETAAHQSGIVAAMSGIASSQYKVPSLQAWVANAMSAVYDRPLGNVSIGGAPIPQAATLSAAGAPNTLPSLNALEYVLSERQDRAWQGLRTRESAPHLDFQSQGAGELSTNAIDRAVSSRIRRLRDRVNPRTDAFYEKLYEGYAKVSSQLAQDLVSTIENTPAVEYSDHPYWVRSNWSHFGNEIGSGIASDSGGTWLGDFELALKLLKTDLASSVTLRSQGVGQFHFDNHGDGHPAHFQYLRSSHEVIGRLLGEMKVTPASSGNGTLLDETLVMIVSDFGRTWPMSGTCDHWPATSVCMVGGGIEPNQMIGDYDLSTGPASNIGFMGTDIDLIDEGGDAFRRPPKAGDLIYTALKQFGIEDFFIPGGPGEIAGLSSL